MLPPWSALMVTAELRQRHRGQEYWSEAVRGAVLHSQAIRLGRHRNRMHTTGTADPARSELQRKVQPSIQKTTEEPKILNRVSPEQAVSDLVNNTSCTKSLPAKMKLLRS